MRPTVLFVLAGALGGCDDVLWGAGTEVPLSEEGYAGVQEIADAYCLACHSANAAQGQLDLQTDLHNAVVGVASSADPTWSLVVPGDPQGSLLFLKVTAQTPPGTGSDMPPGSGGVPEEAAQIIEDWIADGAPAQ